MFEKIGNSWFVNKIIIRLQRNEKIKKYICDLLSIIFTIVLFVVSWVASSEFTIFLINFLINKIHSSQMQNINNFINYEGITIIYMGWAALFCFKLRVSIHSLVDKVIEKIIKKAWGEWLWEKIK